MTQEDFKNHAQRISVIIMVKMLKHPLTSFHTLASGEKRKFNRLMNEYLKNLGEEWEQKLIEDFNQTCDEDLFTNSFNPELIPVSQREGGKELLLTDEQKEFVDETEYHKLMLNFPI